MKEVLESQRVKVLRKQKGFTQKQLANFLQISTSSLNKIENGHRVLTMRMAARIVSVLDCSLKDLYKLPPISLFN